jgi:transposase
MGNGLSIRRNIKELTVISIEEKLKMLELYRKGVSISEIARQTGRDRKTVRKAVTVPKAPVEKKKRRSRVKRERKISAFEGYLRTRMAEGVYNTRKLYRELRERGYDGGLTAVILYVQPYRPKRDESAVMRFETEPGQQAQVDWGYFGTLEYEGRQRNLYAFIMTLGWSRAMYVEFTVNGNTDWFIRCHQHAFEYFGGIPNEMLHDNLKSAVIARDSVGRIIWNERYLDFATYSGFTPHPCRPYRAQTKGKVERGIKYVRQNFWAGLHFTDLDDLNQQVQQWLNGIANVRIHGTTGEVPFDRMGQEQLQPLPRQRFDTSIKAERFASRDCLVSYDGNFYSVPAAWANQLLLVKETEDRQLVLVNALGEVVARHRKLAGRYKRAIIAGHYAGLPVVAVKAPPARALQTPLGVEAGRLTALAPQVEIRPLDLYQQLSELPHE